MKQQRTYQLEGTGCFDKITVLQTLRIRLLWKVVCRKPLEGLQFLLDTSDVIMLVQPRGVVNGIDFLSTGEVKKINVARIQERLDSNCIVILSNLGYSASGEVLNCK